MVKKVLIDGLPDSFVSILVLICGSLCVRFYLCPEQGMIIIEGEIFCCCSANCAHTSVVLVRCCTIVASVAQVHMLQVHMLKVHMLQIYMLQVAKKFIQLEDPCHSSLL